MPRDTPNEADSAQADNAGACGVTLLRCAEPGKHATKRWRWDGRKWVKRSYSAGKAADAMVQLEIRTETMQAKTPWLIGTLHSEVASARAAFRDQAVAARGAVDAALGVAEGLAGYVRSQPGLPVDSEQLMLPLSTPGGI